MVPTGRMPPTDDIALGAWGPGILVLTLDVSRVSPYAHPNEGLALWCVCTTALFFSALLCFARHCLCIAFVIPTLYGTNARGCRSTLTFGL
jgi:hypothetical protein